MDFIFRAAEKFLKSHKRLMRYRRIFAVLAAVVVFTTTYELILPAITMDKRRAADTPGVEVGVAAENAAETEEYTEEYVEEPVEEEPEAEAEIEEEASGEESADPYEEQEYADDSDQSDSPEDSAAATAAEEAFSGNTDDATEDDSSDWNGGDEAEYASDFTSGDETADTADYAEEAADQTDAAAEEGESDLVIPADQETSEVAVTAVTADTAAEQLIDYPVTLTFEGEDYTITATYDETAKLPDDVSLEATEILPDVVCRDKNDNIIYDADAYDVYLEKTVETLEKDGRLKDTYVASVRFFDISFIDPEGNYLEPAAPVIIAAQYKKALSADDTVTTSALRFDAEKDKTEIYETKQDVKNGAIAEISFVMKESSVYGIAAAEALVIEEITANGDTYEIIVSYDQKAKIPEGATLETYELMPGTEEYEECSARSTNTDENGETASRFFNISIMADGAEYEPEAPVGVRITLKDTAPEEVAADKDITHYTNAGDVENIPQEVEETTDGSAEVSFRMDSFSTVEVPLLGASNSFSVEVGKTITLTGTSTGSNHYWTTSASRHIQVTGTGTSATVKGLAVTSSAVTVTHEYGNKEQGNKKNSTETFRVSVTETATSEITEIAEAKDGKITVSVRRTGSSKKLGGYTLVVDKLSNGVDYDAYAHAITKNGGDAAALKAMYHIYLKDKNDNEVSVSNANMEVTITDPELAGTGSVNVGHFKKNSSGNIESKGFTGEESTVFKKCSVSDNSLTIKIQSFSVITVSVPSTAPGDTAAYSYEYESNSIIGASKVQSLVGSANQWQIVDGKYENNTSQEKTTSSNGRIRVQKNVIPTDTENEFLMYLSVDINRESILYELFHDVGLVLEKNHSGSEWGPSNHQSHCEQAYFSDKDTTAEALVTTPTQGRPNPITVNIKYKGVTYSYIRYGQNNSYNQGWVSMKLGDTWYIVGRSAKGKTSVIDITLDDSAVNIILAHATNVEIGTVVDTMGTGITATEIISYKPVNNSSTTGNSATISSDGKTINWNMVASTMGYTNDGWYPNIAELVYKIKYDPAVSNGLAAGTKDIVTNPAAQVATNSSAKITYKVTTSSGSSSAVQNFDSPVIRGMLYEIKGKKLASDTDAALRDAGFTLYYDEECTQAVGTEVVTGTDGMFDFANLQYGTYYLRETTVPAGYRAVEDQTIRLCYTDNSTVLTGQGAGEEALYKPGDGQFTITDPQNVITVTKDVAVQGDDIEKTDVNHTIYIALRKHDTNEYVTDSSGDIICKAITITNGSPDTSVTPVTFAGVDSGIYDVMELEKAPEEDPETGKKTVVTVLAEGYRFTTDAGKKLQVAEITGTGTNTDQNGETADSTSNNADLRYSNTSSVKFKNTYSHQTTISKTVVKQWWSNGSVIPAPDGATVKIKLYRTISAGNTPEAVEDAEITLDGTVDGNEETGGELTAWQATFANLDVKDESGNDYIYLAREISGPDDFEPYANASAVSPMRESDYLNLTGANTITNKKKPSITIKKVDNKDTFLPGAKFKLTRVTSDESGEHEDQVGDEFTFTAEDEAGITIDSLASGTYRLTELSPPKGYIIENRTIEFTVDASGTTGSVVAWTGGTKPDNVKPLSTTNGTNDTITVVNTPGAELPEAGGTGFLSPQTLCGIMAMAFVLATAVMYGFSTRRGERRSY